jgi:MBG domain
VVINKATPTATLAVSNSPQTYNGLPQAATVVISVSSVGGTVSNVKYDGSATVPTNAGTYAVTADFAPTDSANYNTLIGLSAGNFVINKAPVTATAGSGSANYDGATKSPSPCVVMGAYTGDLTCANNPASVGPAAGTYPISPSMIGDTTNFAVTPFNGSYTINPLGFNGFLSPIGGADATGGDSAHPIRTVKLGSTLPVKFIAYGSGGIPWLTGIHTIQAIKYSSTTTSDPIDVSATDSATTGNQFRLTDGQWHFNMSTKAGFSQGTWKIIARLEDGTEHYAWIEFKK